MYIFIYQLYDSEINSMFKKVKDIIDTLNI